jgi:hypothetical protein
MPLATLPRVVLKLPRPPPPTITLCGPSSHSDNSNRHGALTPAVHAALRILTPPAMEDARHMEAGTADQEEHVTCPHPLPSQSLLHPPQPSLSPP